MSTGDITRTVPAAQDDDWRERIEQKLDAVVVALLGDLKHPGGALRRLDQVEGRVASLEETRATEKAQRLTWTNALGLAAAGGVIAKALDWIAAHLK